MKQVLCLLLVAFLGFPLFAGGESEDGGSSSGGFNMSGYPIVDEPVTLDIVAKRNTGSREYPELETLIEAEKITNVRINWNAIPDSEWDVQKSLILSSGDMPHAFFGVGLNDADVANNLEFFQPLEDLVQKYSPNIVRMFELEPDAKKMATAPDGHIYGLPKIEPNRPAALDYAIVNTAWLEKLNMKMPETTEEFRTMLRAFKENDMNGNGDPNDEIPITFSGGTSSIHGIMSLFVGPFGETGTMVWGGPFFNEVGVHDNDEVFFLPAETTFREGMKYGYSLFSEGLIDPEVFTQDWSMFASKFDHPEYPIVGVYTHWASEGINDPEIRDMYGYMLPLEGPDGHRYWRTTGDSIRIGRNAFELPKSNEIPGITMRWIDYFYDEEVSLQIYYGPIGVAIEKHDDDTYTIIDPPESSGLGAGGWLWLNGMGNRGPIHAGRMIESKIRGTSLFDQYKYPFSLELKEFYPKKHFPNPYPNREESEQLSILHTDIWSVVDEYRARWMTKGGADEEWDQYLKDLERVGLEEYIEICQRLYDNW